MTKIFQQEITFSTKGELQFLNLTDEVKEVVKESKIKNGLVSLFAPHATGLIILNEDESGLRRDIKEFMERIIPKEGNYIHSLNAHSHLRSLTFGVSQCIPVVNGELKLGTWQEILWVEVDVSARKRKLIVTVIGD